MFWQAWRDIFTNVMEIKERLTRVEERISNIQEKLK